MKKALITGITGQDGSYLAEFLINKGYEVHGIKRRASSFNTHRIDHLYQEEQAQDRRLILHYGDMTDAANLSRIMSRVQPHEVYNLAAQSHVAVSFEEPEYTADVVGLGTTRLLEAIRTLGLDCRFYQASSSELFGKVQEFPQTEKTPFYPRSPYAVAKLYAYWMVVNYRESYNMFACNGILFNHESALRGETFVTRKITRALARIVLGISHTLYLGNMDARRDWGHARDYVRMQWLMLQQDQPEDFVIATGQQHSVREFLETAAEYLGITLEFDGNGVDEIGIIQSIDMNLLESLGVDRNSVGIKPGDTIVKVDPRYFRPAEVDTLQGDPAKAREKLGWQPEISFRDMVREMVLWDIQEARKNKSCVDQGFRTYNFHE